MSWFSKLRNNSKTPGVSPRLPAGDGGVHLNVLAGRMLMALPRLEKSEVDLHLLRARMADLSRDLGIEPDEPEQALASFGALDGESQRRLTLAVSAMDEPAAKTALAKLVTAPEGGRVTQILIGFAQEHQLLTVELLLQSSLRREEFSRHFIARLGANIVGETPEQSREQLQKLDYRQLLAAAEQAKLSAEERSAYIRKLQEEQEQRLGRRGKF